MPDYIARKRLKQKVLERWENEGGKINTEPAVAPRINPTGNHESRGNRSSPSRESSSASTRNAPTGKRKSRGK
jgi:hypothetical protein